MDYGVLGTRLIEYKFTPFDKEEYLQKIGMAALLGQIDCSSCSLSSGLCDVSVSCIECTKHILST